MTDVPSTSFTLSELHRGHPDFRALIEHSAELIIVLDPHGRILYQSPGAVRQLGCDRNPTLHGYHVNLDYLHPDDRDRVVQEFRRVPPGVTLASVPTVFGTPAAAGCGWKARA